MINLVIDVFNRILPSIRCRTWGRNQTPKPEPPIGRVKMKNILSLSSDRNEVDRIMEMKLYHKWELNEMGSLGLYSEDWFSSQEGVFRG
jgi:hypothetical protein